jgi:hypothetical protein
MLEAALFGGLWKVFEPEHGTATRLGSAEGRMLEAALFGGLRRVFEPEYGTASRLGSAEGRMLEAALFGGLWKVFEPEHGKVGPARKVEATRPGKPAGSMRRGPASEAILFGGLWKVFETSSAAGRLERGNTRKPSGPRAAGGA